jgi:hypothetical protein
MAKCEWIVGKGIFEGMKPVSAWDIELIKVWFNYFIPII